MYHPNISLVETDSPTVKHVPSHTEPTPVDDVQVEHGITCIGTGVPDGDPKPPAKKLKRSDENGTIIQPPEESDHSDMDRPATQRV